MHDNMKTILAKARKSDLTWQRRVEAQKGIINRLLEARESKVTDAELIERVVQENGELREENLELKARIDAVLRLVNVTEEGAQQIRVDLVREALDG